MFQPEDLLALTFPHAKFLGLHIFPPGHVRSQSCRNIISYMFMKCRATVRQQVSGLLLVDPCELQLLVAYLSVERQLKHLICLRLLRKLNLDVG